MARRGKKERRRGGSDAIATIQLGAGAAFVVYLSSLTSIKFTATQYALFSSMMLFVPKLIAGYAGGIVDLIGYSQFFIFTAVLGLPVLVLIYRIKKQSQIKP